MLRLVNAWRTPESRALCGASTELAATASWLPLLIALYDRLGGDPADALRATLADDASAAGDDEAAVAALAPLAERLDDVGRARFGGDLWNRELLRAEGFVVAGPGLLAAHLPADAARLDVRVAGLDVDPGFVPELGRVVRFVYGGAAP